jgi:hypothetical protein
MILKDFKILKYKNNLENVIMISFWDTWKLVQSFKIIKFKKRY